jgi:tetratricopeptide (TPR) repeat protein
MTAGPTSQESERTKIETVAEEKKDEAQSTTEKARHATERQVESKKTSSSQQLGIIQRAKQWWSERKKQQEIAYEEEDHKRQDDIEKALNQFKKSPSQRASQSKIIQENLKALHNPQLRERLRTKFDEIRQNLGKEYAQQQLIDELKKLLNEYASYGRADANKDIFAQEPEMLEQYIQHNLEWLENTQLKQHLTQEYSKLKNKLTQLREIQLKDLDTLVDQIIEKSDQYLDKYKEFLENDPETQKESLFYTLLRDKESLSRFDTIHSKKHDIYGTYAHNRQNLEKAIDDSKQQLGAITEKSIAQLITSETKSGRLSKRLAPRLLEELNEILRDQEKEEMRIEQEVKEEIMVKVARSVDQHLEMEIRSLLQQLKKIYDEAPHNYSQYHPIEMDITKKLQKISDKNLSRDLEDIFLRLQIEEQRKEITP